MTKIRKMFQSNINSYSGLQVPQTGANSLSIRPVFQNSVSDYRFSFCRHRDPP